MPESQNSSDPHDPAHVSEKALARGYLAWIGVLTAITLASMVVSLLLVRWLAPDIYTKLHF